MAAPPTGPTETEETRDVCFCVNVHGRTMAGRTDTHTYLTDEIIEGQTILQHKLKHTHYHPPPLCSVYPLFKFMAVVCKIYLCMYLYSIYVLVGHKMWFSEFCFYFEGHFISTKKMW